MFGLGAREAVLSALHADDARGFGSPCSALELVVQLSALGGRTVQVRLEGDVVTARLDGTERERGAADALLRTAAFALGWRPEGEASTQSDGAADRPLLRFRARTP
jgi:hypothetical protein